MHTSANYLKVKGSLKSSLDLKNIKTTLPVNKSNTRLNTSRSLNNSVLSIKNKSKDNGIKLPSSFYNDRRQIYVKKSRALSQRSLSYQSREISFSDRKKLQQQKIEKIVKKRSETRLKSTSASQPTLKMPSRLQVKQRLTSLSVKRQSQLLNSGKDTKVKNKILLKQITEKRKQSSQSLKWSSPFRDTNTFKSKFQGKQIVAKKFNQFAVNSNPAELKVLNLDRLFRKKDGKLGNIVPLPVPKIQGVASRSNVINTIKNKDTIHAVIQQYNRLLRIYKLQKTHPRIGVRGHNFVRVPTLQQLMGIKIHEHKKRQQQIIMGQKNQISDNTFIQNNQYYKKYMKQHPHLTRRLLTGIKQQNVFTLSTLIRFYAIFINRIATLNEKIKFLQYFFIPQGQQKIPFDVLKLILEIMCQELPAISNLEQSSELLSKKQKSKIFFQALNRVLFADLRDFATGPQQQVMINREILNMILQRNEDAVDLLIKLLIKQ